MIMEGNENKGRFSRLVNGTQKPKPSGETVAAFICSLCAQPAEKTHTSALFLRQPLPAYYMYSRRRAA